MDSSNQGLPDAAIQSSVLLLVLLHQLSNTLQALLKIHLLLLLVVLLNTRCLLLLLLLAVAPGLADVAVVSPMRVSSQRLQGL